MWSQGIHTRYAYRSVSSGMTGEVEQVWGRKVLNKATFAGGCFWCMQLPFEKVEGVITAVAGYSGGTKEDATYKRFLPEKRDMSRQCRLHILLSRSHTKHY